MQNENKNTNPQPEPNRGENYQDFDAYVNAATVAIDNGQLADVQPLLDKYGFTATVLKAKRQELDALVALNRLQKKEIGEALQATENFNQAKEAIHGTYIDHLDICREIFEDDYTATKQLHLNGKRKRSISGYLAQGLDFYTVLDADANYKALANANGITNAEIAAGKTAFTNLKTLENKKYKEDGEGQEATKARDKALDKFDAWFSKYCKLGRIALKAKPQMMERLGWLERS